MTVELRDQLNWEKEMIGFGVARFRNQEAKALERGDHTGTQGGKRLLKSYLAQVSEFIAHYVAGNSPAGRRRSKYTKLMQVVDPDKLALFSLTEVIRAVYGETDVTAVARRIGVMIEDEVKFAEFELALPDLFNQLQRDMDRRNSESYRHRHRVLTHAMNKQDVQWAQWGDEVCVGVGSLVLSLTLDATDIVYKRTVQQGRKRRVLLQATDDVKDWLVKSDEALAVMMPDRMPCLIPPEDWEDPYTGGYHLPRLRSSTALIKFRRGRAGTAHRELMQGVDLGPVASAVNAMQRTPWRVNQAVLGSLQAVWDANLGVGMPQSQPYEIPASPVRPGKDLNADEKDKLDAWKVEARELHALERHRQSLVLGVARTMRVGEMLKQREEMYYVYQLDFRGRGYAATSGVSPQGNDTAKGSLEFATGEAIGDRGMYWLKVHGANKYGYDKCSYDDRVSWIDAQRDKWLQVSTDPVAYRAYWGAADKPYQFLAFCIEYAEAVQGGPSYESRLPIALDGSCNGLQHFSALLRDATGGAAVNLVPRDTPADIYQDVADAATVMLRKYARAGGSGPLGADVAAQNWLSLFKRLGYDSMPRKASKKPVMTLPYGSTQQACTSSIFGWYMEQQVEHFPEGSAFKHCIFMSSVLWAAIGQVVVAARQAMAWIQESAALLAKQDEPLIYTSPLGLPVYQGSTNIDKLQVCHRIGGSRMRLSVAVEADGLSVRKQRQGSSPNLIHHVDAAHMQMCLNSGVAAGITSYAMIHDDFGVHARHIDKWHEIIRDEFVNLHTEHDILEDFKSEQELRTGIILPPVPPKGDLDLNQVRKSLYFFG